MSERSRNQLNKPVSHQSERHGSVSQESDNRGNRYYSDRDYHNSQDEYDHRYQSEARDDSRVHRNSDNDSGYFREESHRHDNRPARSERHHHDHQHSAHHRSGYASAEVSRREQEQHEHRASVEHPREQDVWLKEKQSRITFNDADLEDIAFAKRGNLAANLAGYGGVIAMLGLVGLLAVSSLPELSAVDIIEMDGYAGEQPTKTTFNLASLHDCEAGAECAEIEKTNIAPVTSGSSTQALPLAQTTTIDTTSASNSYAENNSAETFEYTEVSQGISVQEIPAVIVSTSPTVDALSGNTSSNESMVVLQQWSNVRGTPDIDGAILTSLATGKTVTPISLNGQWVEVRIDEKPSVTGYMHRSTIAPQ